ncbi:aryl-alcohol dehydrogenase AAD14 [Capronia epimyces CBS 606.96]|uniref:Aldo-keto reductase ausK n=1 Tax=Capronia epimyces CBS 606.96 TaxID=1182542 RepID=W9ZD25_9EURO|nr:aryl-alcohol dehydrogenase AAD14 [Capronia epimyces CBS 606.96]EXJ92399.1 aryl-alcohol dehydrogenase AAD14 [Capronia epimyces CBS 606.96]
MADFFTPAPAPPTELGRYRILSSTAGVRVSPLQLGAMSIGEAWKDFMGSMNKEQSFKLLDAYFEAGGNFIDTANNYQSEESEKWIGEWMESRGNRDQIVIATKYTTPYRNYEIGPRQPKGAPQTVNYSGNSRRSLHVSVRDSLKKLRTDYIDLLYLHWWDHTTSIEEIMDSLDVLVKQGKVLYLGISDSPAWVVSAANEYARAHAKTPFSVYQGRWNVMLRDFERDIIPMARHYGMALAPWDVLGGGKFQTKKALEERRQQGEGLRAIRNAGEQSDVEAKVSEALEKVAAELDGDYSITAVALAYVFSKTTNVFPIVGGRKVEHLKDNIKALSIKLTDKQIQQLESVVPFEPGFPSNMIGPDPKVTGQTTGLLATSAQLAFELPPKPTGHE